MSQKPIDWNHPLQTKNGFSARVLANDLKSDFPIVVALSLPGGKEAIYLYNDEGKCSIYGFGGDLDLINVPEKVKFYVNIYQRGRKVFVGTHTYSSAEEASVVFHREYVKTIEVEVEV